MSCALSLALPQVALVCADTRLNLYYPDGRHVVNDDGPVSFVYADGTQLTIDDSDRKIRRFPWGWATGVGSFLLIHSCFEHLSESDVQDPDMIEDVLRETYQREVPKIRVEFQEPDKDVDRAAIFFVYEAGEDFGVRALSFSDERVFPPNANYYLNTPSDLSQHEVNRVNHKISKQFPVPTDIRSVCNMIRFLATVFHSVYLNSETVSDRIDLAMMLRTTSKEVIHFRLASANEQLIAGSDVQIRGQLQPV